MSRVKILFCITKSVWGGAGRYTYDLACALPKDIFEIAVAAGDNGPLFHKLAEKNIHTISVKSLTRDVHFFNEIRTLIELVRLYIKEKPDIIHLNSSKIGILGALAARAASFAMRKKIKVIFTAHGWAFREDRSAWQSRILYLAAWFGALIQDNIIVINSRDYADAKYFIPERKLAFIFNGIAVPLFRTREDARENLAEKIGKKISNNTLVIGTIAELTKNKNITSLIEAIPRLNNTSSFHTIIIGEGEEREMLLQKIRANRMEEKISLAGFLPDAASYLNGFDMFVLSSIKEGLPYVILEAMHAGIPIVAANIGGTPDLVAHKKTGFLIPTKSPGHIAAKLNRLAANPALRNKFGIYAQEIVKKKFSFSAMVKKTIAVYLHKTY